MFAIKFQEAKTSYTTAETQWKASTSRNALLVHHNINSSWQSWLYIDVGDGMWKYASYICCHWRLHKFRRLFLSLQLTWEWPSWVGPGRGWACSRGTQQGLLSAPGLSVANGWDLCFRDYFAFADSFQMASKLTKNHVLLSSPSKLLSCLYWPSHWEPWKGEGEGTLQRQLSNDWDGTWRHGM